MKYRAFQMVFVVLLLTLPLVFGQTVFAAEKGKFLCALTEVIECDRLGECAERLPETIGLPDFVVIDLDAMELRSAGDGQVRTTKIGTSSVMEDKTILSGIENRGWSAVLSNGNTRLSATISDEQVGFVVFGACRVAP